MTDPCNIVPFPGRRQLRDHPNDRRGNKRHRPRQTEATDSARPFTRLNNNFAGPDGLVSAAERGATPRDLFVLFTFLAEAQRQDSPVVGFGSRYQALKLLGWSKTGDDCANLDRALSCWRELGFEFDAYYERTDEDRPVGYVRDKAVRRRLEKKREEALRRRRIFDQVWTYRSPRSVRWICIVFADDFWEVNREKKYFCKVRLEAVRKLSQAPHPHPIFLLLLLEQFHWHTPPSWSAETIASKIGLRENRPKRRLEKIRTMVERIADATGETLEVEAHDNGRLQIYRPKKRKKIEPTPRPPRAKIDERYYIRDPHADDPL